MAFLGTLLMSGAVVRWPVPAILVTRDDDAIPYRLTTQGTMMTETRRCCRTSDGPCECVCHANDAAEHASLCDCTPERVCANCREVEARYGLAPIGGGSDEADAPQLTDAELAEIWAKKWADTEAQRIVLLDALERIQAHADAWGPLGYTPAMKGAITGIGETARAAITKAQAKE